MKKLLAVVLVLAMVSAAQAGLTAWRWLPVDIMTEDGPATVHDIYLRSDSDAIVDWASAFDGGFIGDLYQIGFMQTSTVQVTTPTLADMVGLEYDPDGDTVFNPELDSHFMTDFEAVVTDPNETNDRVFTPAAAKYEFCRGRGALDVQAEIATGSISQSLLFAHIVLLDGDSAYLNGTAADGLGHQYSFDNLDIAYLQGGVLTKIVDAYYDPSTGGLTMTPNDIFYCTSFALNSPRDFTGSATLPPGVTGSSTQYLLSGSGSNFNGRWDFGAGSAIHGADYRDWTFTYTVAGHAEEEGFVLGYLPGDIDMDGDIDGVDIQALLNAGSYLSGSGWAWADGDFNGDGLVDGTDMQLVLDIHEYGQPTHRWGSYPDQAYDMALAVGYIPEPASLSLICLGTLALLRRRSS